MATQTDRISALITAIGTDWKLIWANTGAKANLNTTTKASLVDAINEVNSKPTATGGAAINDTTPSGTTTYSSSKSDTLLALKAPLASPTFTGTVSGITPTMVGLGAVDNTADTAKPVSTAQQTALNLKAPLASPAFTGTPTGITKAHVGLGSVDNTADTAKPVSTAQATAIAALISDASLTTATTTTYSANKINGAISAAVAALVGSASTTLDTIQEISAALGGDGNYAATMTAALGYRLRFDAAQTLTAAQKIQGKANLDAYGSVEIGNPDTDLVALYTAAKA
jgi:hypothetical protein